MARAMAAIVVAFAVSGCGTLLNMQEEGNVKFRPPDGGDVRRVYGGVRSDAALGVEGVQRALDGTCDSGPLGALALATWAVAIDLPLSAVGDTLTLPITIPAALRGPAPRIAPKEPGKSAENSGTPDAPVHRQDDR